MNHLFIKYQNIVPTELRKISTQNTHIWIFLYPNEQDQISIEMTRAILPFGKKIHFIRLPTLNIETLQFYLSYELGKITENDHMPIFLLVALEEIQSHLLEHIKYYHACRDIICIDKLENINKNSLPHFFITKEMIKDKFVAPLPHDTSIVEIEQNIEQNEYPILSDSHIKYIQEKTNEIFCTMTTCIYTHKIYLPLWIDDLKQQILNLFKRKEILTHNDHIIVVIIENVISRLEKQHIIAIKNKKVRYLLTIENLYKKIIAIILTHRPKKYESAINLINNTFPFLSFDYHSTPNFIEKMEKDGFISILDKQTVTYLKKEFKKELKKEGDNEGAIISAGNNGSNTIRNVIGKNTLKKNLAQIKNQSSPTQLVMPFRVSIPNIVLEKPNFIHDRKTDLKVEDPEYQQIINLLKSENRPKTLENLKRFLKSKLTLSPEEIEQYIQRLFKDRYLIYTNRDQITYHAQWLNINHYYKLVDFLKKDIKSNPKNTYGLLNFIRAFLGNKVSQEKCQAILKQLIKDHYITADKDQLSYHF